MWIIKLIQKVLKYLKRKKTHLRIRYQFSDGRQIISNGGSMQVLTDTQQVNVFADEVDARGNVTAPSDTTQLSWTVADPTKLQVLQNADGSVAIKAVGPLTALPDGTDPGVQITVTDKRVGLTQVDFVQVKAGPAVKLGIRFGTPVESV